MKTKKQKIKEYLEAGNVITQRDAYQLFNHTRLAAVIHELRNDEKNPMDIQDVSINEVNESGERVNYSEYYLKNPGGNKNQISTYLFLCGEKPACCVIINPDLCIFSI